MPVELGTHRNGQRFAKIHHTDRFGTVTVEATGLTDDVATELLQFNLRQMAEWLEDAAAAMNI